MDSVEKRRRFIINFAFFLLVAGSMWFVFNYLLVWLVPFIIGFIIAYLMNPLISFLERRTFFRRRFLAYGFTIILSLLLGLLVWLASYGVIQLVQEALLILPDFFQDSIQPALFRFNSWFNEVIQSAPSSIRSELTGFQTQIIVELQGLAISLSKSGVVWLTNLTRSLPNIPLGVLFTILATIFTNLDYPNIRNFLFSNMPKKYGVLFKNMKVVFAETIGKYLKAYLKIMTLTFLELSLGFFILGVPKPILVGLLIATFDILPVLGTGGVLVPWILLEVLLGNLPMAAGLGILYIVVTVVRNLAESRIVGGELGLNPLVTLVSIYLGFSWFGVFGMLLVPIATNIFLKLYQQGKLKAFVNLEELYGPEGKYCENDEKEGC